MACLESQDLSELAKKHITAQQSVVKNLRTRLSDINTDYEKLKQNPDADPFRLAEHEKAIYDLEYHLNGNVRRSLLEIEAGQLAKSGLKPERLTKLKDLLKNSDADLLKDPDLVVAEERVKVMESLYTSREQLVFKDTVFAKDSEGKPKQRLASIFGAPTVKKLLDTGETKVAEDLILRSISRAMSSEQLTRNPNDYIDIDGLEVKKSLSDGIEHHHIFNNVYVDENGRVKPNSIQLIWDRNTSKLGLKVIPEYWNSAKHGSNTQFIELMDGAHSGDDAATHLHYYRFDGEDDKFLRQKIADKVPELVAKAKRDIPRYEAEIIELEKRIKTPKEYEKDLTDQIGVLNNQISVLDADVKNYQKPDKNGRMIQKSGLTDDEKLKYKYAKDARGEFIKEKDKLEDKLNLHKKVISIKQEVERWSREIEDSDKITDKIKFNSDNGWLGNKDVLNHLKALRITSSSGQIVTLFPITSTGDIDVDALQGDLKKLAKKESQKFKQSLIDNADAIRLLKGDGLLFIKESSDLEAEIKSYNAKLIEAKAVADIGISKALKLYEDSNGFFSLDKGYTESEDYSDSRPTMNGQIHKYNARQAVEHLESAYGDDAIDKLNKLADSNRKANMQYSMITLQDKLKGSLI